MDAWAECPKCKTLQFFKFMSWDEFSRAFPAATIAEYRSIFCFKCWREKYFLEHVPEVWDRYAPTIGKVE